LLRAFQPNAFVSPEQLVQSSISLAHADRRARVSVAGPDGLAAKVSLCRGGFERVECVSQATRASAEKASDVLLIAGPLSPDELSALLQRTCRLLRDGGELVVQLTLPSDDQSVRSVLERNALMIASTVFDLSAGCLVSHTVTRPALQRVAG
jgi:hypothetical protein